jgi:GNAT superfamily N-acetyltransferase
MQEFIVRPYRAEDRAAVRHICYATGQLGDTAKHSYADFESFTDIFSAYYTDHEPEHAWVAERDGKVEGYFLGCLDTRRAHGPEYYALRHVLTRGVCFRPGTAAFYWRGVWDTLVDAFRVHRTHVDLARYPSHFHINLLPAARRRGVAETLFRRGLQQLKRAGSQGVHGIVSAENARMLAFSEKKLGFARVGKPYLIPCGRSKDGRRVRVQVIARDLTNFT